MNMGRHRLQNLLSYTGEAGAIDGLVGSNTYFLERFAGWTGLLVEPYKQCAKCYLPVNRPAATVFNGAICTTRSTMKIGGMAMAQFACPKSKLQSVQECVHSSAHSNASTSTSTRAGGGGGGGAILPPHHVPCLPLTDIFRENSHPRIDLFSLDVENHVTAALKSLDFEKVDVSHYRY